MSQKPYRVYLNGENFLADFDGKPEKMGFYTTRWVLASDPESAEAAAVLELRGDERLRSIVLNAKDDPPMLYVERLAEANSLEPPTGFAFYSEGKDESVGLTGE